MADSTEGNNKPQDWPEGEEPANQFGGEEQDLLGGGEADQLLNDISNAPNQQDEENVSGQPREGRDRSDLGQEFDGSYQQQPDADGLEIPDNQQAVEEQALVPYEEPEEEVEEEPMFEGQPQFINAKGRLDHLRSVIDAQLDFPETLQNLQMAKYKPTPGSSVATQSRRVNRIIQSVVNESLGMTEYRCLEKIKAGNLLNDEEIAEQQPLAIENGEVKPEVDDGADENNVVAIPAKPLTTQDIAELKDAKFKKLMINARKKEIKHYIEQSWSDSLITKREKEWRLEDLEENADDLFYPTKARELEIRLGFYNYEAPTTDKHKESQEQDEKAAKDFIKSIKKDRADREAKQLQVHLREEERALEMARERQQRTDAVAQQKKEEQRKEREKMTQRILQRRNPQSVEGSFITNMTLPASVKNKSTKPNKDLTDEEKAKIIERASIRNNSAGPYRSPVRAKKAPLFKQLAEKYEEEKEMSLLESKKKRLEEIRSLVKPINPQEITQFDQKYQSDRKQGVKDTIRKRKEERALAFKTQKELPSYNNPKELEALRILTQKDREIKQKYEAEKAKMAKLNNYAELVKKLHVPQVNSDKANELKKRIDDLEKKERFLEDRQEENSKIQPESKAWQQNMGRAKSQTKTLAEQVKEQQYSNPNKTPAKKAALPMTTRRASNDAQQVRHSVVYSYLTDQRQKRDQMKEEENSRDIVKLNDQKISRILADPKLTEFEKMQRVRNKADLIQERAKMEEKKLRQIELQSKKQNGKLDQASKLYQEASTMQSVEQSIAVNDIYIESIKAKLQILNNI